MTIAFNSHANLPIKEMIGAYKQTPESLNKKIFNPMEEDKFEVNKKPTIEETEAPKIGFARILFNRLTPEQIETINKNREMPKNAKFVEDPMYGPRLTWNIADITPGTHTLPAGYELKNDILGFTHVVREGTQAWYLKK